MNLMLTWTITRLAQAKTAEDVFGELKGDRDQQVDGLKAAYHQLARLSHPDMYPIPVEKSCAQAAFSRLTVWYEAAQSKIKAGQYGKKTGSVDVTESLLQTKKHTYRVSNAFSECPLYNSYPCRFEQDGQSKTAVLKIVRDPQHNDLAQNEAQMLRRLENSNNSSKFAPYLPGLIDSFIYSESGADLFANVFTQQPGWASFEEVHNAYPGGIDPKDMAWMWRRLLVALGFAHASGIIHGAVLPGNVFIQPEQHGLRLDNWTCAVEQDGILVPASPDYQAWYPFEVAHQQGVLPGTDIDLAARCMFHLLGGDPLARTLPPSVPGAIQSFLRGCTLPGKNTRPQDSWALKEEFDDLLKRLYGERKFHPFYLNVPLHNSSTEHSGRGNPSNPI